MVKAPKANEIESRSDAWEQFERAVDTVVKAPPQHRARGVTPSGKSPDKVKDAKNANDQRNAGNRSGDDRGH